MGCRKNCWFWYLHDILAGISTWKFEAPVSLELLKLSGNGTQSVQLFLWHRGREKAQSCDSLVDVLLLPVGSVCHILLCFPLFGCEFITCNWSTIYSVVSVFPHGCWGRDVWEQKNSLHVTCLGQLCHWTATMWAVTSFFSDCRTCSVCSRPPLTTALLSLMKYLFETPFPFVFFACILTRRDRGIADC